MALRTDWISRFGPLALAIGWLGCGGGEDSLTREKAAMEQEAKALAQREVKPLSSNASAEKPAAPPPGVPGEAAGIRIPAGLEFRVAPTQSLSSRTAQTGADWPGKLVDDLTVEGVTIARAGTDVVGRFLLVSDATRLRKKHELEMRVYKLKRGEDEWVDIRTMSYLKEGSVDGKQPVVVPANEPIVFKMGSGQTLPRPQ